MAAAIDLTERRQYSAAQGRKVEERMMRERANDGESLRPGDYLYPGLREDPKRRARWEKALASVQHTASGEKGGGSFDLGMKNEDCPTLPSQFWRRPDHRRRQLEVTLDNQLVWNEAIRKNPMILNLGSNEANLRAYNEDTTTANIVAFVTQSIPMILRLWPRLFFQDLVPTIAVTQPRIRIHFLDYLFGTSGQSYAVGTRIDNNEDPDYTDDPGECSAINEIDARITNLEVVAETLKVLSTHSMEAAQDAMAYHNFDLGAGLDDTHARLLARNINRKVVEDLRTLGTATAAGYDKTTPAAAPWNTLAPREYGRTLFDAMLDVDNSIASAALFKSSAAIGDPDSTVFLEKLNFFNIDPVGDRRGRTRIDTTPNLFGRLDVRWDYYEDWYLVPDQIVIGARGNGLSENAYAYFPFIDIMSLPPWTDPRDMCVHRGAMTRFGRSMYNPIFWGRVNLTET